ncbi:FAD-dependent oxidoreductase [Candidatus Clostridium stratigraminis]|uniref:FAD-dependent oxidoreductase n=1 Tax=Candidatus Clostridium stratigraminis TaxID=3381661 RepID=A0ABW8T499_9CLOT
MKKEIIKTDVAVFGGGPGGISAAVAAARQGAKTLIVERLGFLGGGMTTGLPLLAFLDVKGRTVTGGIAQEIVDRLTEMGGSYGHRICPFHNSTTIINPLYARIVSFQMIKENNIEPLLHSEVIGAGVENGKLVSVTVMCKGTEIEIQAKVFIDATGDGDVAYLAGARYEKGQEGTGLMQPPTLMFDIGGVKLEEFFDYLEQHPEELPYGSGLNHIRPGYNADFFRESPNHVFFGLNALISKLRAEGKCPIDRDTVIYINQPITDHVAINTIRILNFDGTNASDLSRGEMEGHLQILPLIKMLQENVPGFEDCYLSSINPTIGVRETRRVIGKKMLHKEEVINGDVPADTIGLGSYIIDIHNGEGNGTYIKTLEEPYGIPYGCTLAEDIDGLMLSGRCISVDAVVFGSSRVMPTCMAVGEGAGVGAALAVKHNISPSEVNTDEIRNILIEQGAILSIN